MATVAAELERLFRRMIQNIQNATNTRAGRGSGAGRYVRDVSRGGDRGGRNEIK